MSSEYLAVKGKKKLRILHIGYGEILRKSYYNKFSFRN